MQVRTMALRQGTTTTPARGMMTIVRRELALSDHELAAILAISIESLHTEAFDIAVQEQPVQTRLQQLGQLTRRLQATFSDDGGGKWLHATSHYLGGMAPVDALAKGQFDRVEAALEALDWGIFA